MQTNSGSEVVQLHSSKPTFISDCLYVSNYRVWLFDPISYINPIVFSKR